MRETPKQRRARKFAWAKLLIRGARSGLSRVGVLADQYGGEVLATNVAHVLDKLHSLEDDLDDLHREVQKHGG